MSALTQLVLSQTAKAEADARLREAQAMRGQGLEGSGPDAVPDVLKNPLIQNLKQQQSTAEAKLADLSAQYGPRHPLIINGRKAPVESIVGLLGLGASEGSTIELLGVGPDAAKAVEATSAVASSIETVAGVAKRVERALRMNERIG